jgi:hypothetical protein
MLDVVLGGLVVALGVVWLYVLIVVVLQNDLLRAIEIDLIDAGV